VERGEAELFDKPFEPRIEAEDADHGEALAAATTDAVATESSEADEAEAASASAALAVAAVASGTAVSLVGPAASGADLVAVTLEAAAAAKKAEATAAAVPAGVPVGSTVELRGLSSVKYNGKRGVVLTPRNADGRQGVRIIPVRSVRFYGLFRNRWQTDPGPIRHQST